MPIDTPTRRMPERRTSGVWTPAHASSRRKVVKIRWVKPYEEAQNHVFIGQVLEETPNYLKVLGKTYHFRKAQGGLAAVQHSPAKVRWIPWNRIEVVTELPEDTDWEHLRLQVDSRNQLCVAGNTAHGELIKD